MGHRLHPLDRAESGLLLACLHAALDALLIVTEGVTDSWHLREVLASHEVGVGLRHSCR